MRAFTILCAVCVIGFVFWYFTNDAYVILTNESHAPASIYVDGATVTTIEVDPNRSLTVTLPLRQTQFHSLSWSVNYPNGYHYRNRNNAFTMDHWQRVILHIEDAPSAILAVENLSMGEALLQSLDSLERGNISTPIMEARRPYSRYDLR